MAHYLLFFPNASGCSDKILIKAGLSELVREGEQGPEYMEVPNGPGGKNGVLVTWRKPESDRNPRFLIHSEQEWVEAPSIGDLPAGRYWVGIDKENPPEPMDLVRDNPIGGLKVTLADGYSWTVPTISRFPNRYKLLDGGEISRVCKDEYAKFYELGMKVVAEIMKQFSDIEEVRDRIKGIEEYQIDVTAKDGLKLIASALALNYRINWELCFLLGLLDERTGALALMTFCELSEIREAAVQKKTLKPVSIRVGSYS